MIVEEFENVHTVKKLHSQLPVYTYYNGVRLSNHDNVQTVIITSCTCPHENILMTGVLTIHYHVCIRTDATRVKSDVHNDSWTIIVRGFHTLIVFYTIKYESQNMFYCYCIYSILINVQLLFNTNFHINSSTVLKNIIKFNDFFKKKKYFKIYLKPNM